MTLDAELREVSGDYLRAERPIFLSMETWPRHIDHFKRQYEKAFMKDPLFGAYLMDRIHKRVQVFLHSCNTTAIEDVESGALIEFSSLQKNVEKGDWLTSTTGWVDWTAPKEEVHHKSDGHGFG